MHNGASTTPTYRLISPIQTYINPERITFYKVMGSPTIVHFDLPADDPERAKKFYEKLFDWKFNKVPMPTPYYLIETKDSEGNPGIRGGMGKRRLPGQKISNYIDVPSIDECVAKVKKLGGNIISPKRAVPGWGYLAICVDTEDNIFGLWEENKNVKYY